MVFLQDNPYIYIPSPILKHTTIMEKGEGLYKRIKFLLNSLELSS